MSIYSTPSLPPLPADEITEVLMQTDTCRVERILSWGQTSPDGFWYDQDEDEWVVLLQGEAELDFGHERVRLQTGQSYMIPAHARHRVTYTSAQPPCIWLCVFSKTK
ncbi:MAG TPA: cupin domain-containing protein [Firmicutes bacterium]|nr:cupin domain-containing protein [Bacillota bacterium]